MQAQGDRVGAGASGALVAVRWLLMIALAVAAVVLVRMATRQLGVAGQSASFYVISVATSLAPAVVYAVAVVLTLSRRGGRQTWSGLLACGLVLCAIALFYLVTWGFGELMVAPLCLVVLSLMHLLSRPRPSAEETR